LEIGQALEDVEYLVKGVDFSKLEYIRLSTGDLRSEMKTMRRKIMMKKNLKNPTSEIFILICFVFIEVFYLIFMF
jgi:hypothetical protein